MRLVKRLFWITILALIVVFAVINWHDVEVVVDPLGLGFDSLRSFEMPMAYVIFFSLAVGLLVGVLLENDRGRPIRRELSRQRSEVASLRGEANRMQKAMKDADHPDSAGLPVRRS